MTDTSTSYTGPDRVFSGVQPTGSLHLGNYLGMLKPATALQDQYNCIYCVVDLHAITVPQDPKQLTNQTREIAAAFLASGIDPARSIIFAQSSVFAHTELTWYLNCVARIGWLERMTQFKDKAAKDRERSSVGLFDYPVLMAADILAYKGTHVPVGEDQKQHLELARDIADRFNREYDVPDFFPLPEPLIGTENARIMSLKDGMKKMSKSDPSDLSRINLTDTSDAVAKKIRKARTDAEPIPETAEALAGRPEVDNLIGIFASLSGQSKDDVCAEFAGKGFGDFKPALADLAVEQLAPVTAKVRDFLDDPAEIDRILGDGADRAGEIATPILQDVRQIIGFWRA
ncbi:MAG: tryptophan--tRNA ligase [Pseudomonadota bacterium]